MNEPTDPNVVLIISATMPVTRVAAVLSSLPSTWRLRGRLDGDVEVYMPDRKNTDTPEQ